MSGLERHPSEDGRPVKRRRAIKRSCEACTTCHSYCDRARPECNTCARLGRTCVYPSPGATTATSHDLSAGELMSPATPSHALSPPVASSSSSSSSDRARSPSSSSSSSSSALLPDHTAAPPITTPPSQSKPDAESWLVESGRSHSVRIDAEKIAAHLASVQKTIQQQSEMLQQQQLVIEQQSFMLKAMFNMAFGRPRDSVLPLPQRPTHASNWRTYDIAPALIGLACKAKQLFALSPDTAAETVLLMQKKLLDDNSSRLGCVCTIHPDGVPRFSGFTEAFARLLAHPISTADNALEILAQGKIPYSDPSSAEFLRSLIPQVIFNPSETAHILLFEEAHAAMHEGQLRTSAQFTVPVYNHENRAISVLSFIELHGQSQAPTTPAICIEPCQICTARQQAGASLSTAASDLRGVLSPIDASSFDAFPLDSPSDMLPRSFGLFDSPASPALVESIHDPTVLSKWLRD